MAEKLSSVETHKIDDSNHEVSLSSFLKLVTKSQYSLDPSRKKQTWGVEGILDILFWKNPWNFSDLSLEISDKTKLHP